MFPFFGQLELARPAWLAALVLVPLVFCFPRHSLARLPRGRRAASLVFRSLLLAASIVALAGPRVERSNDRVFVVAAVDRSDSISAEGRRVASAYVEQLGKAAGGKRVLVLPFASRPGRVVENSRATNLARAIRQARARIPAGYVPQVVLLSDGLQTEGDGLAAGRAAGVPVCTVRLASRFDSDVAVREVKTPAIVRQGEPFFVDVLLHSSHDDEGTLKLVCEEEVVDRRPVTIEQGTNPIRFPHSVTGRRRATLTASLEGFRDSIAENNEARGVVFFAPRPKLLVVASEARSTRHLAAAFDGERIEVAMARPVDLPESAAGLEAYDLLILANVPAASLPQSRMEAIRTFVGQGGGGLITIGGDRAFTPGGYHETVLEEVLPVVSVVENEGVAPGLAIVLVLDRSGSMEEAGALELAKEASRRAVGLLHPDDSVGVIAFQDYSRWTSPLEPCADKTAVLAQIDTLTPGGGTNLYPAMEKAFLALRHAPAKRKHVIVLTDGLSHPGDFHGLAHEMADAAITISTVAIGPDAVRPLLEDIARIGNGHAYQCNTPETVPEIFALEAAAASRLGIVEEPVHPKWETLLPALAEIDLDTSPPLSGYVKTRPKPTAHVVMRTEKGDPLLVWWRYGLGVSVAFTSEVQGRWTERWLEWPGFATFWSRVVRHSLRRAATDGFTLNVERRGAHAVASLDARDPDGRFLNGLRPVLTATAPAGTPNTIAAVQAAPGLYTARFPASEPGIHWLEMRLGDSERPIDRQQQALVVGYADEFVPRSTGRDLLRSIAEATGGTHDASPADVLAPSGRTVPRTTLFWPYLLAAAAVLLVLDLAARRVGLGSRIVPNP